MIECETTLRQWGNSVGATIPKELLEKEDLKVNERVKVLIVKQDNTLKETFGLLKGKFKKSAQEIKDEIRKELHGIS